MTGRVYRCDEEGCDEHFPERPVEGWYWQIQKEAQDAGWKVGQDGDFCPLHVDAEQ